MHVRALEIIPSKSPLSPELGVNRGDLGQARGGRAWRLKAAGAAPARDSVPCRRGRRRPCSLQTALMASQRCAAELPDVHLPHRTGRARQCIPQQMRALRSAARAAEHHVPAVPLRRFALMVMPCAQLRVRPKFWTPIERYGRRAFVPAGSASAMDHYRDYGNDDSGDDANPSKQLDGWVCYACIRPAARASA